MLGFHQILKHLDITLASFRIMQATCNCDMAQLHPQFKLSKLAQQRSGTPVTENTRSWRNRSSTASKATTKAGAKAEDKDDKLKAQMQFKPKAGTKLTLSQKRQLTQKLNLKL